MNLTAALFGAERISIRRLLNLLWGLPPEASMVQAAAPSEPEAEIAPAEDKPTMAAQFRDLKGRG